MENFKKTIRIGRVQTYGTRGLIWANAFATIKLTDGKLSITGVVGPKANGDAWGGCGQINMSFAEYYMDKPIEYAEGWDRETLERFLAVWDEWHLNDMVAGSPAQEAYLRANPVTDRLNYYTKACEALEAAGLQPDPNYIHNGKPYSYGTAWLRKEVPEDVLAWLKALPEADMSMPAVWQN